VSSNRLAGETSAYLRQHAGNPVHWMPWGTDAFQRARDEDRPIFLSIGYASCHWCHVMEHESFANPHIAAQLNAGFVCIKVDREERPDVDALYIAALLEFQGHAGWPATLFLLPDLRPFTGVTYLPPVPRHGLPSLPDVLDRIRRLWETDRGTLLGAADMLRKRLFEVESDPGTASWDGYRRAVATLVALHDPEYGGFGQGAKFPQTPELELLLQGAWDGLHGASDALRNTLIAMDRGGLQDHLAGGFHRYCVDRQWTVPHFEKLLYDNAQLIRLYARASCWLDPLGGEEAPDAMRVVRSAIGWLERELRVDGAFSASFDADDPGGEGAFYTWTPDEAAAVVGTGPLPYGIRLGGNFEHGRTVLNTRAGRPNRAVRDALLRARQRRPAPPRDDKQVVAWNALAVGALAEAGRLFGQDLWVDFAAETAERLLAARGRTLDGTAPAVLEDRVQLADALIALYQARPAEPRWLLSALAVAEDLLARYGDPDGGCFPSEERGDLFVRRKEWVDGAEPCGNGRLAEVLRQLVAFGWDERGALDRLLAAGSGTMERTPAACPELWRVVRAQQIAPKQGPITLVLAGGWDDPTTQQLLRVWNATWRPHGLVALVDPALSDRFPLLADKPPGPDGAPRAYVCRNGRCDLPVDTPEALIRRL
jgi:uncharacterized protein YyaL (SSP411 family)